MHFVNFVKSFIQKVSTNSTKRDPVDFSPFEKKEDKIDYCSNIMKNFYLEEESKLLKTTFLRESSPRIFDHLPYFQTLTKSTLLEIADKVEMCVTHPEQALEKD